ncbi:MAG: hypothetical protein HRK26_05280 [Rickettsiaceae bacterium H1]|nr:hypothetical protein [Rickettsiaceae bacterium H1]
MKRNRITVKLSDLFPFAYHFVFSLRMPADDISKSARLLSQENIQVVELNFADNEIINDEFLVSILNLFPDVIDLNLSNTKGDG